MCDQVQIQEKTDRNGFLYYDKLPEGYQLATLEDFHLKGVKKIGMKFLILWVDKEYYEVRQVTDKLTGQYLKPFIDDLRVFIKKPN